MHASIYIATSLDGFIARLDGGLDWLTDADPGDADYGFADFLASVDALVMGRNTFDFVREAGEVRILECCHVRYRATSIPMDGSMTAT